MPFSSLRTAFRRLQKNPGTGLFNIASLAIGISAFSLLFFYIQKELSYDRHHSAADRLYRIVHQYRVGDDHNTSAWTSPALITYLQGEIPEVEEAVRLFRYRSPSLMVEKVANKHFTEANAVWADANVFSVFSFDFLKGDSRQALTRPNTMVITEAAAKKYFGSADPIGQVLHDLTMEAAFEVTAVVRDMPEASHFKADLICSLSTLPRVWGDGILTGWDNSFLYSYIKVGEGATAESVESRINALMAKRNPASADVSHFSLQPVPGIHLHSNILNEWQANADIRYVYILILAGILILLVSAINYINLWIARSEQRTKEIGIRKVIGSSKVQLSTQLAVENLMEVLLAFLLSMALVASFGPLLENALGEHIQWLQPGNRLTWIMIGAGILLFMLVAMIYPIGLISKIQPSWAMKGTVVRLSRGLGVWQGLIVFQVLVTAMLITGTLLINRQLSFMQHRDIGYDADHLLNISQVSEPSLCERLKREVLQHAYVKAASGVSHLVGGTLYQSGYVVFKKNGAENVLWQRIHTDHDFCRTYNIPVVAGRDFSRAVASDTVNFIINETACRHLGFKDPADAIGLEIAGENQVRGSIIGVMKDFHFKTLHSKIEPLIIHIVPGRVRMLSVNVDEAQFAQTLRWIEGKWKTLMPSVPFVYTSLGDFNAGHYVLERRFGKVIVFFTLIAFFLSVSGLVSLNIYIASLKKKEIGIRKVLGANISALLFGLSKRFAFMTVVGFVVSIPLSWYAMSTWLSGFAYRVDLTGGLFIIAGIITLILSMVSIAIPSIRAAISKPADILKAE